MYYKMIKIRIYSVIFNKIFRKILYLSHKSHISMNIQSIIYAYHIKYLYHYLLPYLNRSYSLIKRPTCKGTKQTRVVWIFWFQGYRKMPLIIKKCIDSIRYHSNGCKVVLLTKFNINLYIKLSNFFVNKVKNGEITLTHFSDIIRFYILRQYGGLWCDATIYCTGDITNNYFNYLYTCGSFSKDYSFSITDNKWTLFLIGGNKNNALFQFMCKFYELYWKNNECQLSYFLSDLALRYAYQRNIGYFKNYTDKYAKKNNPNLWKLSQMIKFPYSLDNYRRIKENTDMFKLTYKLNSNFSKQSFYYKLLHFNLYKII